MISNLSWDKLLRKWAKFAKVSLIKVSPAKVIRNKNKRRILGTYHFFKNENVNRYKGQ